MGSGFKDFSAGDVLTAADVDGYLMRQTVMVFASSSARDSALSGVLADGMVAYLTDSKTITLYDGSNWVPIGGSYVGYYTADPPALAQLDSTNVSRRCNITTSGSVQSSSVHASRPSSGAWGIGSTGFNLPWRGLYHVHLQHPVTGSTIEARIRTQLVLQSDSPSNPSNALIPDNDLILEIWWQNAIEGLVTSSTVKEASGIFYAAADDELELWASRLSGTSTAFDIGTITCTVRYLGPGV